MQVKWQLAIRNQSDLDRGTLNVASCLLLLFLLYFTASINTKIEAMEEYCNTDIFNDHNDMWAINSQSAGRRKGDCKARIWKLLTSHSCRL